MRKSPKECENARVNGLQFTQQVEFQLETMATSDAFKEINFRFDDDLSLAPNNNSNTEVVIHRKQRRPAPPPTTTTQEEEDFRRNCRQINTSTPKKAVDVKLAIHSARSSFFGLDDDSSGNYDDPRRDSQMDTAEILDGCCLDKSVEGNYRTCDINNNKETLKTSSHKETESGLGSISAASDEPDAKSPEKVLLLDDQEANEEQLPQRNIIREPQYYPNHPSQVS